jgi:hypothetical protein
MITLDSSKFKPHDAAEAQWLASTHEKLSQAIIENELPIKYIRVGRQVKSYGSTGVHSHKVEWRDTQDNTGVWINGHHRKEIDLDRVIKHMVKSTLTWRPLASKTTSEHKLALKLKYAV